MGKVPTLATISELTGFSTATVSLVLRNQPGFAESTVELIRQTAYQLGYQPNRFASSLRGEISKVIGYLLPDNGTSEQKIKWSVYDQEILSEFVNKAEQAGFSVSVMTPKSINSSWLSNISVLYSPDHLNDQIIENYLLKNDVALITNNYSGSYKRVLNLIFDYPSLTQNAIDVLKLRGSKKIAILTESHLVKSFEQVIGNMRKEDELLPQIEILEGEYSTFDPLVFITSMMNLGFDSIISTLEIGEELVEAANQFFDKGYQKFSIIPSIDFAYVPEDSTWLKNPLVASVISTDTRSSFDGIFDYIPKLHDGEIVNLETQIKVSFTAVK